MAARARWLAGGHVSPFVFGGARDVLHLRERTTKGRHAGACSTQQTHRRALRVSALNWRLIVALDIQNREDTPPEPPHVFGKLESYTAHWRRAASGLSGCCMYASNNAPALSQCAYAAVNGRKISTTQRRRDQHAHRSPNALARAPPPLIDCQR